MEYYKKFGMIVMVLSIVLFITSILISNISHDSIISTGTLCSVHDLEFFMKCLYLGSEDSFPYKFPLKYALAVFVSTFALGFLWYKGALKVPAKEVIKDLLD